MPYSIYHNESSRKNNTMLLHGADNRYCYEIYNLFEIANKLNANKHNLFKQFKNFFKVYYPTIYLFYIEIMIQICSQFNFVRTEHNMEQYAKVSIESMLIFLLKR